MTEADCRDNVALEALPAECARAVEAVRAAQLAPKALGFEPCGDTSEKMSPERAEKLVLPGVVYVPDVDADESASSMRGVGLILMGAVWAMASLLEMRSEQVHVASTLSVAGAVVLAGVGVVQNLRARGEAKDPSWRARVKGLYLFPDAALYYSGRRMGLCKYVPRPRCKRVITRRDGTGPNPSQTWLTYRTNEGREAELFLHRWEIRALVEAWLEETPQA